MSPYTLWTKSPPCIMKLKFFGCQAVILVRKEHREWKLSKSRSEGIFLGYENDMSSYRILQLSDKKVFVSRHVICNESVFPFLTSSKIGSRLAESLGLVDESQPPDEPVNIPCSPVIPLLRSCIKVIGPRHPALITADVSSANILPYSRRAGALETIASDAP
ncbi:hypothetical protein O181_004787 [Austropuccinia psidii MF-1]|uniref:Retroviral polymerase SH3-like domain-containing protein n=1 Tax=Austropuccinia psidii MF-1 TaxID=1389203 RepID=A0A9Q3GG44_9BASI|nr:hypothetical protein [Austropuccinia psidii MF-1]